jgi:uncharacterized protein YtpQ (UPF0354 family)
MTKERHALIVPLLKQLGPDLGGQAGRSRRARGRRWGKRLRQAAAGPIEIPPEAVPIVEPFLAGLGVAYAFDMPYGYEMLGPRHCTELGVPPESLRGLALANLRLRRPEQTLFQATDAMAIGIELGGEFGGDLEASLVLDDEVMTRLAERFSGDLVVAIPDRDMLVATGTGHADGPAKLQSIVDDIWPGADHPLTQRLLVRRAGEWQFFEMA